MHPQNLLSGRARSPISTWVRPYLLRIVIMYTYIHTHVYRDPLVYVPQYIDIIHRSSYNVLNKINALHSTIQSRSVSLGQFFHSLRIFSVSYILRMMWRHKYFTRSHSTTRKCLLTTLQCSTALSRVSQCSQSLVNSRTCLLCRFLFPYAPRNLQTDFEAFRRRE